MIPIHALLARIRWDPAFGRGEFVIGYYDRVARRIVRVPLRRLAFADHDHFACTLVDDEGKARQLPLHRICIGTIVRINQRTATLDCDGQSWRVSFPLLRHLVDL